MFTVEKILHLKEAHVISVSPDATVREAAKLMEAAEVGCVVVEDEKGLAGLLSERDLVQRVAAKDLDLDSTSVGEVMSFPVRGCSLSDNMQGCVELFDKLHCRHLPVIEEEKVIGLISVRDVLAVAFNES